MGRINIWIPDAYTRAFNVFKIMYHGKIESEYSKVELSTAVQYMMKHFFGCENLKECENMVSNLSELERTENGIKQMKVEELKVEA